MYQILLGVSLALVCFFVTGCGEGLGGKVFKEIEDAINNGEISKEEGDALKDEYSGGLKLDGVKVLRRPSNYDYANSVVGGDDYYFNFARDTFYSFYRIYGILNNEYVSKPEAPGTTIFEALFNIKENDVTRYLNTVFSENNDNLKYYYDAIRYQITDVRTVNVYKEDNPDTPEDESIEIDYSYIETTADTSKGWSWIKDYTSFNAKASPKAFIYSIDYTSLNYNKDPLVDEIGTNVINRYDESGDFSYSLDKISTYYNDKATTYSTTFVNSDFIYTLAYAIYCNVLNVTVRNAGYNSSGEWIVEGYEGADEDNPATEGDERTSSYQAYLYMKEQFRKYGSYVGLTKKNKKAIKEYILSTVIGQEAMENEFLASKGVNMYYSDIVDAVVEYCGKLTTIGKSEDEDDEERTPVGDSFIASEILDFPSTGFFVSSNDEDEFESISPNEYQSIVFMPSVDDFKVSDIWLDFKYTAIDRNTNEEIDDKSLYIDIYVQIRWWNGTELSTIGQKIRVYNGIVDVGTDNTTLCFELDGKKGNQNERGDYEGFGEAVKIDKFNCEDLDVKTHSDGKDDVSGFDYMRIKGRDEARHYYDVVNSSFNTGFGSYGVLKSSKFEGQSYLEITFDVEKKSNDENYDFCVGLSKFDYNPSYLERYDGV